MPVAIGIFSSMDGKDLDDLRKENKKLRKMLKEAKGEQYKEAFLDNAKNLEEAKKLLGECYLYVVEYDPETMNPRIRFNLMKKIKQFLDGGTIQ